MMIRRTPQPTTSPMRSLERPVRVLHVVPELMSGGMERAMLRLINRSLQQDQHAGGPALQHGLCVLKNMQPSLADECPAQMPMWVLGSKGQPSRYTGWHQLRGVIRRFGPDVVHARSTGAWFDAAAAVMGMPQVRLLLSFHGRTSLDAPSWRRRVVDGWTTRRANAVLTVSHDSAEMLRERLSIPGDKLVTIHNGVDTSRFCPSEVEGEVADTRQRMQIQPSADLAICVANLVPIKNLDVLVRAWRQIHMADPLARLLLIGEGPQREQLANLINASRCGNLVRLLGARDDVAALLRAADVFVLPSRYEGCSNAVLEAMASGLPVLATQVGGTPEIITHNRNGWLVPPGDGEHLGEMLLTVLLDRCLRNRVGAAARDTAVKHFGIDTWVARHAALYRRLAGLRAPRRAAREEAVCAE